MTLCHDYKACRSIVITKPPRVGICLGRTKGNSCLEILGRNRPRLIHFLKNVYATKKATRNNFFCHLVATNVASAHLCLITPLPVNMIFMSQYPCHLSSFLSLSACLSGRFLAKLFPFSGIWGPAYLSPPPTPHFMP